MPLLWLRVATLLYGAALVLVLRALAGRSRELPRAILPLTAAGAVFHLVAFTELYLASRSLASLSQGGSLLALLLACFALGTWALYRTSSPGIFAVPLVFLLTFFAAVGEEPPAITSPLLRSGWIFFHIALIFAGYAALIFSFIASLLYLLQEKNLKAKQAAALNTRLPALETIDDMGYRSLLVGFPFMTLGLVFGAVIAQTRIGPHYFADPKVLLSLLMWAVYLVLLYTRWSSGWRGRRAAALSTFAFVTALAAWGANYLSAAHRFVQP